MFYGIAVNTMELGHENSWLFHDDLASLDDQGDLQFRGTVYFRYLRAAYWSYQTIATVAFGDISAYTGTE
jgi:hypothetical protein